MINNLKGNILHKKKKWQSHLQIGKSDEIPLWHCFPNNQCYVTMFQPPLSFVVLADTSQSHA
jgi:hypothetical protein